MCNYTIIKLLWIRVPAECPRLLHILTIKCRFEMFYFCYVVRLLFVTESFLNLILNLN